VCRNGRDAGPGGRLESPFGLCLSRHRHRADDLDHVNWPELANPHDRLAGDAIYDDAFVDSGNHIDLEHHIVDLDHDVIDVDHHIVDLEHELAHDNDRLTITRPR
jgi:hypothetical protein